MIDLAPRHMATVQQVLAAQLPGMPVYAFGSRVMGKAKKFSDLDLMVRSDHAVQWRELALVREAFEASDLPIMVDVIDWSACSETFRALVEPQLVPIPAANPE